MNDKKICKKPQPPKEYAFMYDDDDDDDQSSIE